MGHDRHQRLDRRLSNLQSGPLIGPHNPMDKYLPLRSLWGPQPSNYILIRNKTKNTPPKRPGEVHITAEALYKKI